MKRKNKMFLWFAALVVVMFGFGYALVPLYDVLCQVLGINGKTEGAKVVNTSKVLKSRVVTMQFLANSNGKIPVTFKPVVRTLKVHPGENERVAYYAKNNSSKTLTIRAVPSVTPFHAADYLKKTQCFCFETQTLKPGEAVDMPIVFHLTDKLPKNINEVTLSYTVFVAK